MSSGSISPDDILTTFLNILRLEADRGYSDAAVQGGLERFAARNSTALAERLGDPQRAEEFLRLSYSNMNTNQRCDWVCFWTRKIEEIHLDKDRKTTISQTTLTQDSAQDEIPKEQDGMFLGGLLGRQLVSGIGLDSPVSQLPHVGKKTAERLSRLGIATVKDVLYFFPRRHDDFSRIKKINQLVPDEDFTVICTVWQAEQVRLTGRKRRDTEAVLGDETGNIRAIWFGQHHVSRNLLPNSTVMISGRVTVFRGNLVFQSPEYEVVHGKVSIGVHTGRLVPVYSLTDGLSARTLRRIVWNALDACIGLVRDSLPSKIINSIGLMPLSKAIVQYHYPDTSDQREEARNRLAFDELFLIQIAVLMQKAKRIGSDQGIFLDKHQAVINTFVNSLPFELTSQQMHCIKEISQDVSSGNAPMSRLLQGEVGSGKTVVALAVLILAAANGYQAAIMAPTEILAGQHFRTITNLLEGLSNKEGDEDIITVEMDGGIKPIVFGLLTGSMSGKIKKNIRSRLLDGTLDVIVGTHAIIQDDVDIPNLALAVVDEQQRFGVAQRAALREMSKGRSPHILGMTATPIPRTLALTIYGDLDISTIDKLPMGRQRVVTRWVSNDNRVDAYRFISKHVAEGRQAFVICPLIDESESLQVKAAVDEHKDLVLNTFPNLRLGLLHGRMNSANKERVMREFLNKDIDILVSTPVVEVGIDIPNATIILIEGSDRFGLSQLHQFRGRVGRGEHKSYCLLFADDPSDIAKERLDAMERIHDGFELAEVDLTLRGPGEYFGTKQSGFPDLKVARISDRDLLAIARKQASRVLEADPYLKLAQHKQLSDAVNVLVDKVSSETS